MRFLFYLGKCFNKSIAEKIERGKVFESQYDKEVAEARFRAIDYIYAFMGSAIDHTYPFLPGGFINNLPDETKKCFEVFWLEKNRYGYLVGLRSAARQLNMPIEQLKLKLDRIDAVMKSLAHKEVKVIMKLNNDKEIKQVLHFFKMNVQQNKNKIMCLR